MLNAIKRLTSKNEGSGDASTQSNIPHGVQAMSTSLQRKFAKGIHYNMKVIIKGDRNVGKTCLFHRLQGLKFVEEYIPTDEIQVASIQWNYKATDDIVKVEVWDVVDRGKKKRPVDGLKLENSSQIFQDTPALDAQFLDVYKNTHGVIFVMDSTKSWTFDYIQNELPKVPECIPVIILANHCDMSHHRTVSQQQIQFYIEQLQRRSTQVRYTEASMRNGFGLKLLHKFFNLPFLQLQRETIQRQLERNSHDIGATIQELDLYAESEDADYNAFIDKLTDKRRQVADLNSPRQSIQANQTIGVNVGVLQKSNSIIIGGGQPIPVRNLANVTKKNDSVVSNFLSSNVVEGITDSKNLSVDEFIPEATLDRSFLDDVAANDARMNHVQIEQDSDSDADERGNPLVKDFQDDLDDLQPYKTPTIHVDRTIDNFPVKSREFEEQSEDELKQMHDDSTLSDNWSGSDSKWRRRSPEGGEDVSNLNKTLDAISINLDDSGSVNSSVNCELLKDGDRSSKNSNRSEMELSKKQKSKKSKEKEKKKSKSKKRDETKARDELEEFLNGTNTRSRDAYEAI